MNVPQTLEVELVGAQALVSADAELKASVRRLNCLRASLKTLVRYRELYRAIQLPLILTLLVLMATAVLILPKVFDDISAGNGHASVAKLATVFAALPACIVSLIGVVHLGYTRLGRKIDRRIRTAPDVVGPAAVACVARALTRPHMPARDPYMDLLTHMSVRLRRVDWEIMTQGEVHAIVRYAADRNFEWAFKIGLTATQSAATYGELRAIQPLRAVLKTLERHRNHGPAHAEQLRTLLANLEAQAAQLQTTNALLRPADENPQLLRAAADSQSTTSLMTPADGPTPGDAT